MICEQNVFLVAPIARIWHLIGMNLLSPYRYRFCLLLLLLGVTACGPRPGQVDAAEAGNAVAEAAYAAMDAGKWEEAVKLFHDVLEAHPELSRVHLDAAMLLQDHVDDPVRAIYHYARYLELRPKTEKRKLIQQRITEARNSLGASGISSQQSAQQGADLTAAREQAQRLQQKLAATDKLRTDLARALKLLQQERARTQTLSLQQTRTEQHVDEAKRSQRESVALTALQRERIEGMVKLLGAAGLDENGKPLPRPRAAGPNAIARSYTVRRGDSLSKIAYKVYGDATQWRKIQKANDQLLRDSVKVQVGQVLVIP